MPRYYLHLDNAEGPTRDESGEALRSDADAIAEAGRAIGITLTDDLRAGRTAVDITITIEREDGSRVAIVRASAAVEGGDPSPD